MDKQLVSWFLLITFATTNLAQDRVDSISAANVGNPDPVKYNPVPVDPVPVDPVPVDPAQIDHRAFSIDNLRYQQDQKRRNFYDTTYEEPMRDSYSNNKYEYGTDDYNFTVTYNDFSYKPYDSECDTEVYDEYGRYLANYRGDWYSERESDRYEVENDRETYPEAVVDWRTYDAELTSDYTGPTYDDTRPIPNVTPSRCCNEFRRLPRRAFCKDCKTDLIRKEYRQLSYEERMSFHQAIQWMKGNGTWDTFAQYHISANSPYAHGGASFLPWHRELLHRIEQLLYKYGYIGPGLPYWDSTMDQLLPTPSDSAMFTDDYMGNVNGPVVTGPAAFWSIVSPVCQSISGSLFRNAIIGQWGKCFLMSDFDVNYVYNKQCFRDLTCNTDCKFESDHAGVHTFIGGHMGSPSCAPNDPIFYMHHAFIDCIWEKFRQEHQVSRIDREYPSMNAGDNVGVPQPPLSPWGYEWNAEMYPFGPLLNGHGIERWYESYYQCMDRPLRCSTDEQCDSPILWCHNGRCLPKVKFGGDCTGLPSNACVHHHPTCGTHRIVWCNNNRCECAPLGRK